MKYFITLFFILFSGVVSLAQTRSYPTCSAWDNRIDLDNFCPRMEGVHLPNCCPPLIKMSALTCDYQIVKDRGQPFLANSSYTTCENNANVTKPCCTTATRACYTDPVSLKFLPRLINRQASCCFEQCPPASYWRAAPNANPKITANHELTGGSVPICTQTTLQECSVGTTDNCPVSDFCPIVIPGPQPGTDPGPGTGPGPVTPGPVTPGPVTPGPVTPSNPNPGPTTPPNPPNPVDPGGT